jgi:hypothetical protein
VAHDSFIRGGWQFVTRLLQNGRGIVLDVKSILVLEVNLAIPTIVAIVGRIAAPPKSQLGVKTSENHRLRPSTSPHIQFAWCGQTRDHCRAPHRFLKA